MIVGKRQPENISGSNLLLFLRWEMNRIGGPIIPEISQDHEKLSIGTAAQRFQSLTASHSL